MWCFSISKYALVDDKNIPQKNQEWHEQCLKTLYKDENSAITRTNNFVTIHKQISFPYYWNVQSY